MNQTNNNPPATSRWVDQIFRYYWPVRQAIKPLSPSQESGMGAVPATQRGVAFRVWAPNAKAIYVTGSFNGWAKWRTPMVSENNGYWSADVPQAQPGDEYKFIIHGPGGIFVRTDPYARDVSLPFWNGVVHDHEVAAETAVSPTQHPFTPPPLNELVIYELHVGTFADDNSNPPGSFAGVISKLEYLRSMGINAIELMPIKTFPGNYSWGYNPSYPFAISRIYGGPHAFKQLVEAAHQHGIAVIVDVVYNHFGPQELSMWRFDGWHENEKGGIYFYNDWRSKTPWADTRPDYGRSEVRRFIRDNVMMWYELFGVDGLRWDATSYIRNAHGHDGDPGADIPEGWSMMAGINGEVQTRFPHAIHIAEDLQNNESLTKPQHEGGLGFHTQWDAGFVHPVRHALITPNDVDRDMEAVKNALLFRYNGDPFHRVVYTESHDEVANGKARVPEEIAPGNASSWFSRKRSILGAALVMTAPGVPMIFQGQEFLEDGWFDDQTALDWEKARTHGDIRWLYRDLIQLRRNCGHVSRGLQGAHINVFRVDNEQKVLAYHRWLMGGAGDDVIVVANFTHETVESYRIGLPRYGVWRVRLQTDARKYGPDFGRIAVPNVQAEVAPLDELPFSGVVALPPYTAVILSQDEETVPPPPKPAKKDTQ